MISKILNFIIMKIEEFITESNYDIQSDNQTITTDLPNCKSDLFASCVNKMHKKNISNLLDMLLESNFVMTEELSNPRFKRDNVCVTIYSANNIDGRIIWMIIGQIADNVIHINYNSQQFENIESRETNLLAIKTISMMTVSTIIRTPNLFNFIKPYLDSKFCDSLIPCSLINGLLIFGSVYFGDYLVKKLKNRPRLLLFFNYILMVDTSNHIIGNIMFANK